MLPIMPGSRSSWTFSIAPISLEARAPFDSIRTGWVTQGPKVAEFEKQLALERKAREAVQEAEKAQAAQAEAEAFFNSHIEVIHITSKAA